MTEIVVLWGVVEYFLQISVLQHRGFGLSVLLQGAFGLDLALVSGGGLPLFLDAWFAVY